MKSFLKRALAMFRWPIDLLLSIVIVPAAHLLLLYRKAGSAQLPMTTRRLKSIGVFPIRNHFYEPLFDDRLLSRPLDADRELPGLDLNAADQLAHLDSLRFEGELIALDLRQRRDEIGSFHLPNGSFEPGDAEYLYQFLRAPLRSGCGAELSEEQSLRRDESRVPVSRSRLRAGLVLFRREALISFSQ